MLVPYQARRANKGVLPSVLGVDGYNPSALNYDKDDGAAAAAGGTGAVAGVAASASASVASKKATPSSASTSGSASASAEIEDPEKAIQVAIETISRYRTGGDGGTSRYYRHTIVIQSSY